MHVRNVRPGIDIVLHVVYLGREGQMKVGFIGLGHMGFGMAANILAAGHEVIVYNRTSARTQPLVRKGAKAAVHVADACRGDVVITMLADDAAIESIVLDPEGVIDSLGKGAVHICMSTISVGLSEKLGSGSRERRPAFCRLTGFWPAGLGRGGQTVHPRSRGPECSGYLYAPF